MGKKFIFNVPILYVQTTRRTTAGEVDGGSQRMTDEQQDAFLVEVVKRFDMIEKKSTNHSLTSGPSTKKVNDAWESISTVLFEKFGVGIYVAYHFFLYIQYYTYRRDSNDKHLALLDHTHDGKPEK